VRTIYYLNNLKLESAQKLTTTTMMMMMIIIIIIIFIKFQKNITGNQGTKENSDLGH